MIKNIILDMGNVLLDYDPNVSLDKYCSSAEEKVIIYRELFTGPEWVKCDLGLISDDDMFRCVKERVPEKYHTALKNCIENWDICMSPIEGAREFCDYIKTNGYGIYVLSNAGDRFYKYFPEFLPIEYFDGVIISADVHIVKPDVRIYKYLLDKFGLNPQDCLFIDDSSANVQGAMDAGINGFVFKNDYGQIKDAYNL